MSGISKEELLKWVDDQHQLDMGVKFVLAKLAAYADADGVTWSPVAVLAKHINRTERTVQNYLDVLKKQGLIKPTGDTHRLKDSTRSVPLYQLAADHIAELARGSMGEKLSPIDGVWVKKSDGMGEANFTPYEPKEPTLSNDSETCVRAQADDQVSDAFEVAFAAWAEVAPARVARALDWAAWVLVCERVNPADLGRAAKRYLAEGLKADGGRCKALHRWLGQGWFEGWLGDAPVSAGNASAVGKFADAAIRASVVGAQNEDWAKSYLDPSAWDFDSRTITPRTSFAFTALIKLMWLWTKLGVSIAPAKALVSGEGVGR